MAPHPHVRVRLASERFCGALWACLTVWSCGGNATPKPEQAAQRKELTPALTTRQHGSPAPAAATEEAPKLSLQVVQDPRGVGLRLINTGTRSVSLAPDVSLAVLRDGHAYAQTKQALMMQLNCKSSGCVTLMPGTEIDAPVWLERIAGERCGALLVPPAAGRYRLGVQTCSGAHSEHVDFDWRGE